MPDLAINLQSKIERASWTTRTGTFVRSLAGLLLVLVGCISALPVLMVLLLTIVTGTFAQDSEALVRLALVALVSVVCVPLGFRLARGRRRLVLYLRKFGFASSTKVLTYAISTAVGRRWRLVTLDDSNTEAYGVSGTRRRVYRFIKWLLIIGLVIALWQAIAWYQGDPFGDTFSEAMDDMIASGEESGQNAIATYFGAFIGAIMVTMVVMIIALIAVFVPMAILTATTFMTLGATRAVNRAEASKKYDILHESDIKRQIQRIVRSTRRMVSPRLIITHVSDAIWQKVIRAVDSSTEYVIIDVSKPTEHLLWEIRTLQQNTANRIVYIGQREHLDYLNNSPSRDSRSAEIQTRLNGETVITYQADDHKAMRVFARSLRAQLESFELN